MVVHPPVVGVGMRNADRCTRSVYSGRRPFPSHGDESGSRRTRHTVQVLIAYLAIEHRAFRARDPGRLEQVADSLQSSRLRRGDRRTEYVFVLGQPGPVCSCSEN